MGHSVAFRSPERVFHANAALSFIPVDRAALDPAAMLTSHYLGGLETVDNERERRTGSGD
jgi:hypothetical protein